MAKGVISYKFKCSEFDGKKYNNHQWVLGNIKIHEEIKSPFADLDEGWYVDVDKSVAYFYTKNFDDKNELKKYIDSIKPIDYKLDCQVKYDYIITEYDEECECQKAINENIDTNKKISMLSNCLCKENSLVDCVDQNSKVRIEKLNTCVKLKGGKFSLIKAIKGPTEI